MTKTTKPKKTAKLSTEEQDKWDRVMELYGQLGLTVSESWLALRSLSETLKKNKMPSKIQINWFSSAIDRCKEDDPTQLIRELGLLVQGRRLTVNPHKVAERVSELIAAGLSIMAASEQAAEEIGCSAHAAYRWHRKVNKVKTDARRK